MKLTKEQATEFHDSGEWKDWSYREIAEFQMAQELLCVPFSAFHEAMEATLGRPIFTHEFGLNYGGLKKELAEKVKK